MYVDFSSGETWLMRVPDFLARVRRCTQQEPPARLLLIEKFLAYLASAPPALGIFSPQCTLAFASLIITLFALSPLPDFSTLLQITEPLCSTTENRDSVDRRQSDGAAPDGRAGPCPRWTQLLGGAWPRRQCHNYARCAQRTSARNQAHSLLRSIGNHIASTKTQSFEIADGLSYCGYVGR